ncbi:MAG TPA: pseudouridine synthase [Gammaproteobacteria bacterium]|nr:pseudouridine synthase [Gammaproteobacteria bacterium]
MSDLEKTIKIQKLLSQLGVASRRNCEVLVANGDVTVDGQVAHVGMRVNNDVVVAVKGKRIYSVSVPTRLLMLNKPEGYECSRKPKEGIPSVFTLLPKIKGAQWVLVGRLDVNTSGLLLVTNSGDIAHQLMHPKFHYQRHYLVRCRGVISQEQRNHVLKQGITLDGKCVKFDKFEVVREKSIDSQNQWYSCVLSVGYYRVVRRCFESMGVTVSRLKRYAFGPVSLPKVLKVGKHIDVDLNLFEA